MSDVEDEDFPRQRMSRNRMPMPKVTGLSKFGGSKLESWLAEYELMANTYDVGEKAKTVGLIWYTTKEPIDIFEYVRDLDSYKAGDWTGLVKDLREAFPDENERSKYSMRDLREFAAEQSQKPMTCVSELTQYRLAFVKIGKWLQKKNLVTEAELAKEFLRGLPKLLQTNLALRESMVAAQEGEARNGRVEGKVRTHEDLYEEVRALLDKSDNFYASTIRQIEREDNDLPPPGASKNQKKKEEKASQPVPAQLPVVMRTGRNTDSEVDKITRELSELRILVASMQQAAAATVAVQPAVASVVPAAPSPAQFARAPPPHMISGSNGMPLGQPNPGNNYRAAPAGGGGFVPGPPQQPCMVCKGPAPYHYKTQCPELRELIDKGYCKIDPFSKRVVFPDGTDVPQHPQGMKQSILDRQQATASAAAVEIVGWTPPQVSDGPRQFIASAGEAAEVDGFPAEKRPHETDSEAAPLRKKKMVPVVEIPVPYRKKKGDKKDKEDDRFQPVGDVEMADDEMPPPPPRAPKHNNDKEEGAVKKTPSSRPWSKVIEQYGDEVEGIPRTILDSRISLSVGSILTMSKDMAKTLTEEFRVKRVPVPTTTWQAKAAEAAEAKDKKDVNSAMVVRQNPTYCGPVGKMLVTIQGIELEALFDTGSEINLCPKRVYAKTGLALQESNLFLRDANAKTTRLLGYLENVEMKCSRLKTRQHLHVQSDATYDLLLGMPFIRAVSARTWFDSDGSLWVRMSDNDGEEVTICLTRADDPKHRAQPPPPRRRVTRPVIRNEDSDSDTDIYASNATAIEWHEYVEDDPVVTFTDRLNQRTASGGTPSSKEEGNAEEESEEELDRILRQEDSEHCNEGDSKGINKDEIEKEVEEGLGQIYLTAAAKAAYDSQPTSGFLEVAAALATDGHLETGSEQAPTLLPGNKHANYVVIAEGPTKKVWEYKLSPECARSFLRLADAKVMAAEWEITTSARLPDAADLSLSAPFKRTWAIGKEETGRWRALCEGMTDTHDWRFVGERRTIGYTDHSIEKLDYIHFRGLDPDLSIDRTPIETPSAVVEVLSEATQEAWLYKLTPRQADKLSKLGVEMEKAGSWRPRKLSENSSLSYYESTRDVRAWHLEEETVMGWKEMCDYMVKEHGWTYLGKVAVSTTPPTLDDLDYARYSSDESGWGSPGEELACPVVVHSAQLSVEDGSTGDEEIRPPVLHDVGIGSLTAYLDDVWAYGNWDGSNLEDDKAAIETALLGIRDGYFGGWLRSMCQRPTFEPEWESFRRLALGGIYAFTEGERYDDDRPPADRRRPAQLWGEFPSHMLDRLFDDNEKFARRCTTWPCTDADYIYWATFGLMRHRRLWCWIRDNNPGALGWQDFRHEVKREHERQVEEARRARREEDQPDWAKEEAAKREAAFAGKWPEPVAPEELGIGRTYRYLEQCLEAARAAKETTNYLDLAKRAFEGLPLSVRRGVQNVWDGEDTYNFWSDFCDACLFTVLMATMDEDLLEDRPVGDIAFPPLLKTVDEFAFGLYWRDVFYFLNTFSHNISQRSMIWWMGKGYGDRQLRHWHRGSAGTGSLDEYRRGMLDKIRAAASRDPTASEEETSPSSEEEEEKREAEAVREYLTVDCRAAVVEERPYPETLLINGKRMELDLEAAHDVYEGTILPLEGTQHEKDLASIPRVFLAELEGLSAWNMAVGPKEQRGWVKEWRKEEKRLRREAKDAEDEEREAEYDRLVAEGTIKRRCPYGADSDTESERSSISKDEDDEPCKMEEDHLIYNSAAKYKPKGVKVVPVDAPLPEGFRNDMYLPPLSRDPYKTPLTPFPPNFVYTDKLTEERMETVDFGPEGWLWPEERRLLMHVLQLREKALAFTEYEMGRRKETYGPPTKLPLIPHVPWQEKAFPTPAALRKKVIDLFRRQLAAGVFEPSQAGYASKWFAIVKKNGDVRLIMDSTKLNSVTIRDAGVPPAVREHIADMVGYHSYFLIDLFSGYLQEPIAEESRDPTTIRTPIGLLRLTRLPVGGTNSVACFQRRVSYILHPEIPEICTVFIDDVGGKGSETDYGGETLQENPKIRRWLWEHAVKLERVLFRLEEAGLTASGAKLVAASPRLSILGTVVSKEGREADPRKIEKIQNWPKPEGPTNVREFYGLFNYMRDYAPDTKEAEARVRARLKTKDEFDWDTDDENAMDEMKAALAKNIRLKPIDYNEGAGRVIMSVDSSYIAAGIALWQEDREGVRRPVRFDSIPFSPVESRYSQPKLKLAGVFKAFKKYRNELYALHFILEIDATALVQMLRNPDLPNAAMSRWVAYIKLFDFEIRHIPGTEHVVADALSRRRPLDGEPVEEFEVSDNEIVALPAQVQNGNGRQGGRAVDSSEENSSDDEDVRMEVQGNIDYEDEDNEEGEPDEEEEEEEMWGRDIPQEEWEHMGREWRALVGFLRRGHRAPGLNRAEWKTLLSRAEAFALQGSKLVKRSRGIHLICIFNPAQQERVMTAAHEDAGHRGRDATFKRLQDRFWWPRMYDTVRHHVQSCEACQFRNNRKERKPFTATAVNRLFAKVAVDLVHMGEGTGQFKYLIVARDDLSGWCEARALRKKNASDIAKFLYEDVISRMGIVGWITSDNGSEMAGATDILLEKYQIPRIKTTAYHPEANGMVERGHGPLVEAILKISRGKPKSWADHLHAALWADRLTTKRTTGKTPFELVYGAAPLLPIDVEMGTWLGVEWKAKMTTAELLENRTRQLARKEELLEEAARKMEKARKESVAYMDRRQAHRIRKSLPVGTFVLLHNTSLDKQWSKRASDRWSGPYLVRQQLPRGSYLLSELDGTWIKKPVAATRLRRFFPRGRDLQVVEGDYDSEGSDVEDAFEGLRPVTTDDEEEEEDVEGELVEEAGYISM